MGIPLGAGSTSIVRRTFHHNKPHQHKAVKTMEQKFQREFLNEVKILQRCNYPLIIESQEVVEDFTELNLINDLCLGGDFCTNLRSRPAYSDKDSALIIKSVLLGVNYLHRNRS